MMSEKLGRKKAKLFLEDGSIFSGYSFGYEDSVSGEVVFNTGMTGYPDTLTDPSYAGQILVLTYPLVGNYGVPPNKRNRNLSTTYESHKIHLKGLIVMDYSEQYSHWQASKSLSEWLIRQKVPALGGIDTRQLTRQLREKGAMLGKIEFEENKVSFFNPNLLNLVAETSIPKPVFYENGTKTVALIDCGAKHNIIHQLIARGVSVLRVPWDYDLSNSNFDGLMLSNGPGDPRTCQRTVQTIREVMDRNIPIFGICMGHQLLSLAAGATTYKLKYGHRGQNQPVKDLHNGKCLITSQNHGYAVDDLTLPKDWEPWFANLNDGTNEGIRHRSKPFCSVQFHPEAAPGPIDAEYLFDEFVKML